MPATPLPDDPARDGARGVFGAGTASVLVALAAVAVGVGATSGLWADLAGRVLAVNVADATHYSWWLGHTPHALAQHRSPLVTQDLNWPAGVSALNNTTLLLPAVLLWPLTAAAGPLASLNLLLLLCVPAGTAAMYWALRRLPGEAGEAPLGRAAALVGAAAFGISPAIMNSLGGHVTIAFAPALPVLMLFNVRAWATPRSVRVGLALGLLAAVQLAVGEEVLFQAGLGAGFVLLAVVLSRLCRPQQLLAGARRLAVSLPVAGVVFTALAGYPLYVQFFGRLKQSGNPFLPDYYGADLYSFVVPTDQLWLHDSASSQIARGFPGGVEENLAYVGLPLAATAIGVLLLRPHSLRARCAGVGLLLAGLFALGGRIWIDGGWTAHRGPYALFQRLPVADASLATRFGMLIALFGAALLAFAVQGLLSAQQLPATSRGLLAATLTGACLVPLAPRPLEVTRADAVPGYFRHEARALPAGSVVMVLPYPGPSNPAAMRWQSAADYRFRMPGGYFLGPAYDGRAYVGGDADPPTAQLLSAVAATGQAQSVTAARQAQASSDLISLRVTSIVLGPDHAQAALRATVSQLLGYDPQPVDGVWVWADPVRRMAS